MPPDVQEAEREKKKKKGKAPFTMFVQRSQKRVTNIKHCFEDGEVNCWTIFAFRGGSWKENPRIVSEDHIQALLLLKFWVNISLTLTARPYEVIVTACSCLNRCGIDLFDGLPKRERWPCVLDMDIDLFLAAWLFASQPPLSSSSITSEGERNNTKYFRQCPVTRYNRCVICSQKVVHFLLLIEQTTFLHAVSTKHALPHRRPYGCTSFGNPSFGFDKIRFVSPWVLSFTTNQTRL